MKITNAVNRGFCLIVLSNGPAYVLCNTLIYGGLEYEVEVLIYSWPCVDSLESIKQILHPIFAP